MHPKSSTSFSKNNVLDDQKDSILPENQTTHLMSDIEGLKERKLLLLHISGNHVAIQYGYIYDEILIPDIEKLRQQKNKFELFLIGHDNGVKLRD